MFKSCEKHLAAIACGFRAKLIKIPKKAGKGYLLVASLFILLFSASLYIYSINTPEAIAAPNTNINFQARILKNTGALVNDGVYSIEFKVYPAVSGGSSSWSETQNVTVKNGYVSVSLGSVNPFSGIDWSQEQWLTMNVNGDGEMAPRMKITAVPLALRSNQADSLTNGSGTISASSLAQLAPGSVQSINSSNTLLRLNQTGAGNLLQLQNSGIDRLTVSATGDTQVGGALSVANGLTVGNSSSTTAGTIRWTGTAFEGYNGSTWASLGGGLVLSSGATSSFVSGLANVGANVTGAAVETLIFTSATGVSNTAGVTGFTAPAAGSFRTCLVKNNAVITAGTLNVRWRVNGASVGAAACPMNATTNRQSSTALDAGVVTFNAGDTIGVAFDTAGLAPNTVDYTVYWSVEYNSSSSSLTMQKVYDSSASPVVTTTTNNKDIKYTLSNTATDSNFLVDIASGSTSKFAVQNNGADIFAINNSGVTLNGPLIVNGQAIFSGDIIANGSATGTTGVTAAPSQTNVTNITLTAPGSFANNDVIFINNAGQDYYTRIVSGGGTVNLVVSPAVSYDVGATVTKYNVQSIGATSADYSSLANRFFQGYFLGGVVIGAGSTTISDGNIESTTTLNLQQNGGNLNVGGALNVSGSITGDGAGLTNLNASNITGSLPALNGSSLTNLDASSIASGTLNDARLSNNVTLLGNSFNGVSQLVQLDSSGYLPSLNGSNLTSLSAGNISTGTINDLRLSSNVTLQGNNFNGSNQLVRLNGAGELPSLSGVNLTNINASNISSGTLNDSRLSTNVTTQGNTFNGNNQLVQLNASGELPALSGTNLTGLNANNIASGTVSDSRLSSNVTLLGNSFNGNNQLVQLNSSGELPSLSGINLTALNASNLASGTVSDSRLSSNVVLLNANQTFSGTNQFNNSITANASAIFNGNITIGDVGADTITLNSSTMSINNGLNIGSDTLTLNSGSKFVGIGTVGQNKLTINTPNTADSAAQAFIYTNANSNKGLVVQGTASQTGNLQEWQLSSGSAPTYVNSSGQIVSTTALAATGLANNVSSNNSLIQTTTTGTIITTAGASNIVLSVQNTNASATADLIQLKNSGGVALSQFNSSGQLILGNDTASPTAGVLQLNDNSAANGFRITLSSVNSLTGNRNISLPDEAGTVCLANSNNCGYIRLASGSAQADSTTNSSIYVNKTGATGDLITLQDNGANVFRVNNDGTLEIRQTSTSAVAIRNATGTDFFTIDTSGAIIRIGSSVADGTGTLLVLDTKNTAGDPAGENGAMYYNSADGKSRCFEDGDWVDCNTLRIAGETTLAANGGTINVALNNNYEYLECRVDIKGRSAASMVYARFNNVSAANSYGWNAYGIVAATVTDWQGASDTEMQLTGTQTGTNPISADLKITNFTDRNKVVDWTAAGIEAVGTNSNRYSGVGGYYNTTSQITSVQFIASTGTFNAGSHAWCQGKNVR